MVDGDCDVLHPARREDIITRFDICTRIVSIPIGESKIELVVIVVAIEPYLCGMLIMIGFGAVIIA